MTHKSFILCALITGIVATESSFAIATNARSCIEAATNAAGFYLAHTQNLYNEGKDDAIISNSESSLDSFSKGTDDSSTKRGLVYTKFGRDSSGNYISTSYLGKQCGAASNTKLFCHLKKGGSNWTDTSTAPPDPVPGFYMDCIICSGVKLNTSGAEVTAPPAVELKTNELRSITKALNSAISNALHHGVNMSLTASGWPSGSCNTVITS